MAKFEHRCPAEDKKGRTVCRARQWWEEEPTEPQSCCECGFTPGLGWQGEMARLAGSLTTDLLPEGAAKAVSPMNATPSADEDGEAEASPPEEAGTVSRARSAKGGRRG